MTDSALGGVRVLELAGGVAAAFAGKLLADLGAEVVMVEPPGGTRVREHVLFDHLAGGKQSVVVDDETGFGARLATADVVLTDGTSAWHGAATANRPERTVLVDVSPFGRTGPYAEWASSDLVLWAMGGYLYFTGSPDREPIWLPGPHAAFHAGSHAAIAALAALHDRDRSGLGQQVEVSELEATLVAHAWLVTTWAACGQCLERQPNDLIRAVDGWVYVMRIVPKEELFVMIERPDLADENLTVDLPTWNANIPRIFEAVAEWAADKTIAQIVEYGQLLRIAVTPVLDGADVLDDDQLAARDWWEREGDMAFPGQPYNLSATPSRRAGPAPSVGQHSAATPGSSPTTAVSPAAGAGTAGGAGRAPLEGVRIIEITTN